MQNSMWNTLVNNSQIDRNRSTTTYDFVGIDPKLTAKIEE